MIRLALAMVALCASMPAQLELVPSPDFRKWTVAQVWLEKPIVTKTAGAITITNPSFSRGSYVEVRSPEFAILAHTSKEPRPRLRVISTMRAVLGAHRSDSSWIAVHDGPTGARLGIGQHQVDDERISTIVQIPPQSPYPPISRVQVRYIVRLQPRQSWTVHGFSAARTDGPSVRYRAGANVVAAHIDRSNYGGNPMGVIWSQTVRSSAVPLAGFQGAGLLVGGPSYLLFFVPLKPIISSNKALIAFVRSGHWQAIETTPVPALGWTAGG